MQRVVAWNILEQSELRIHSHQVGIVEVGREGEFVDLEGALELSHNSTVIVFGVARLFSSVQLKRVKPLFETIKLALRLKLRVVNLKDTLNILIYTLHVDLVKF